MATTLTIRFVFCALPLLLSACASTTPQWDRQFGASVRTTLAAQVADPAAAANPNPAAGLDGRAALAAQQRYEHSFQQPASPPAVLVNVK
ncbi:MAG: hypothetical protein ABIT83_06565 [Massilia sp.]